MIGRFQAATGILMLLLSHCGDISAEEKALTNGDREARIPSFRRTSEEPIDIEFGTWRVLLSATLIGCKGNLESLTADDLNAIRSARPLPH